MTRESSAEVPRTDLRISDHVTVDCAPPDYGATRDELSPSKTTSETSLLPPAPPQYSPRQRRLLVGMIVVTALKGSMVATMLPFFPLEAARRGVSQTVISGVFSCLALTQIVLYPLVGRLAIQVGVTRLYNVGIATAGLSTIAFGTLSYIPSDTAFVAACFVVRMLEAAGTAAVAGCAFTIIGNQFGDRASTAVALVTAAESAGVAVAPAVGGGLYAVAGFGLPFYTLGGVMVITALVNQRFMPAVVKTDDSSVGELRMLRTFVGSHENWLCLLIVFSYSYGFLTFQSCVAPYANRVLGITPATLGLYFSVASGVDVATSFLWARLAERLASPYPMMALCLLVAAGSQLLMPPAPLFGLAPRWWLFGLSMTLLCAFYGGAFFPCFQLMLAATVRDGLPDNLSTHAFISSVFWIAYSLGSVVGPLEAGVLVDAYGFPLMMTAVAALTLLVALLTAVQAVIRRCKSAGSLRTPADKPRADQGCTNAPTH